MVNEPKSDDLFQDAPPLLTPSASPGHGSTPLNESFTPPKQPDSASTKMLQLIDEHFPALDDDGKEAHQPIRNFLIALAKII